MTQPVAKKPFAATGWGFPGRRLRLALRSAWTISLALVLVVGVTDPKNAGAFLETALTSGMSTIIYIILAVLLIAALKASGAERTISNIFRGHESRMIILASLLGGLAPFCSCEVIPFIAALLAMGTPLSAVMAFWLASPLIDPPTILITASALGWSFAITKAAVAVALGVLGGFTVRALHRLFTDPLRPSTGTKSRCDKNSFLDQKPQWRFWHQPERRSIFLRTARENAVFLIKWLTLAYLFQAVMVHYLPSDIIHSLIGGDSIASIIIGALVGVPAYLNGYVAPALVAGLIDQGMSNGAAMAFLTAGSVTSIPAMVAVWSLVRAHVFATYLALGFIGSVLAGIIFQVLFPLL